MSGGSPSNSGTYFVSLSVQVFHPERAVVRSGALNQVHNVARSIDLFRNTGAVLEESVIEEIVPVVQQLGGAECERIEAQIHVKDQVRHARRFIDPEDLSPAVRARIRSSSNIAVVKQ